MEPGSEREIGKTARSGADFAVCRADCGLHRGGNLHGIGNSGFPLTGRRLVKNEADPLSGFREQRGKAAGILDPRLPGPGRLDGPGAQRRPLRPGAPVAGWPALVDHQPECRQPSPAFGHPRRPGDRTARQRQLRDLPGLRPAPRDRGPAPGLRAEGRAAGLPGLRRNREDRDHLVRPVHA
uniref:Uncharacterized protein n=1 Tax=uncultured bacterium CBNPD1 BAC clone 1664 TaxID=417310 RepID=B1N6N1_9BACT|nr:conserved hypothetical protein [uncultured bacterium CBNPD1 BAC clone 1664]